MNAYRFLSMALVMMGVAFSLTYFGPGTTGYDCEAGGTVTINTPDIYEWNQTGATQMNFRTGAWEDFCIKITTDDVVINCTAAGGVRGTINGTDQTDALIFVEDGLDNVTIMNCHFVNSTDTTSGMGIQLGENGAGVGVSNVLLENNYFYNNTYGILAYNLSNSEIKGNEVEDQIESAFSVEDYDNFLFENNNIHGGCSAFNAAMMLFGFSSIGSEAHIYNNTISNVGIEGMIIWYMADTEIMDNNISNAGGSGIMAYDVRDTTFSGNTIDNNADIGLFISEFTQGVIAENVNVLDNEVYDNVDIGIYVSNLTDGRVSGNEIYDSGGATQEYGLVLVNADPSTISDNEIHDHVVGMVLEDLDDVTIQDNNLYDNMLGVHLGISQFASNADVSFIDNNITDSTTNGINVTLSHGIVFTGNNISDNGNDGLYMNLTENATFDGNYFQNNLAGADLYWCDNAQFENNLFDNNVFGLYVDWSDYVTVEDNEFTSNDPVGVELEDCWYSSVHSNDFLNNGDGGGVPAIYILNGYADNVTSNTMEGDDHAIYIEDSDELYIGQNTINGTDDTGIRLHSGVTNSVVEDNIISNSGEYGIYLSSGSDNELIDNEVYMACQDGALDGAVYVETTDLMEINDNEIHDNMDCDAGLFLGGSDSATIDPNYVYNNKEGITLDTCHFAILEDNVIYNNSWWGVYFDTCLSSTMEDNTIYENGGYGTYFLDSDNANVSGDTYYDTEGQAIYLDSSTGMTMEDCTFYGNGYPNTAYAIRGESADDSNFIDCTFYDNHGAFYLDSSPNLGLYGITSYDNDFDAFYLDNCDNFVIQDAEVYNHRADGYTYYFDDCTGEISDSVSREGGVNTYGFEAYSNSDINLTNFELYGYVNWYLYVEAGSTVTGDNLWIGESAKYGIRYSGIEIDAVTDMNSTYVLLDADFISLNSTEIPEMSVPANLSTRVSGCTDLKHYNDSADDLPTTTAEILANGVQFTPEYSTCSNANNRATYQVDGFSGYMAAGTDSGDGSSMETMTIGVSSNPVTGEEVTITVTDSGTPLSNADVTVRVSVGGVYQYEDLGKTNSAGEVTFTPEYSGNYRVTTTKSGYHTETKYFSVGTGEGMPDCETDADCAVGLVCIDGSCTKGDKAVIEELPGADEGPSGIECVSNLDCPEGYICEENLCIEDIVVEEPTGGPTDEDAMQAIYEAEQAIDAAEKDGKDASEARTYLVQAEQAYASGNYQEAVDAANEAKTLAQHAIAPAAAPTEPEPGAAVVSEPTVPAEPAAAPATEEGFPWIWAILGVAIIAGLAYWFFTKK